MPERSDLIKKDGKEIGFITSVLKSPTLDSVIALAYVKYGFFEPGNSLEIQTRSQTLSASVVELPFLRTA